MTQKDKNRLLTVAGFLVSILPPLIATLTQFPDWIKTSSSCTMSGIALVCILLSIYPLIKAAKKYLFSPSIPIVWAIVMVLVMMLKAIIEQVLFISVIGTISSSVGWVLFRLRKNKKTEE